jgi:hypothetical protein
MVALDEQPSTKEDHASDRLETLRPMMASPSCSQP